MPISMHHEHDNVYRLEVRGTLKKTEMDQAQAALVDAMNVTGRVRLLFVLLDFEGWERSSAWSDLTFYVTYGDRIERIAIVGPERWRGEAMMFAAADLRSAPVEYFSSEGALEAAHVWLTV